MNRRSFFAKSSSLLGLSIAYPGKIFSQGGQTGSTLKLSLNSYSFNGLLRSGIMDLFQLIDFCASQGLEAIDPTGYYFPGYPARPDEDYISRFKRKAYLSGLDISGTGTRNDFTNPDKEALRRDIEHVKEWILVAEQLGSPLLRVFPGKVLPVGQDREAAEKQVADALREVADFGQKHGVLIAMQNHNEFLKTSGEIIRIMKMVDHEWFGLHLDIGSLRQGNPYEEIRKVVGYAITWQVKELVYFNGEPRKTDLLEVFRIAHEAGYRGYLPLETLGEGDPYQKVRSLIAEARKALVGVRKI